MKQEQSRVLAFTLATEITAEELAEVSGAAQGVSTHRYTRKDTMNGHDHTYDSDQD